MHSRGVLEYPEHRYKPEDFLGFTELKPFTLLWRKLNLTDDDLLRLQITIMCDPTGSPVISNTGGVRKLRFSPQASDSGTSGGMRCCYKFYEAHHKVFLALVYPKSMKDNLTAEDKKRIRNAIADIDRELSM